MDNFVIPKDILNIFNTQVTSEISSSKDVINSFTIPDTSTIDVSSLLKDVENKNLEDKQNE